MNRPIITKVAWRLTPTIVLCYFFAYFDRINISFAKLQLQDALLLGAGVILFLLPRELRAREKSV
ncbi:MAG: hypothetical protein ACKVVO_00110 [Opitutaceae bacterium]